MPHDGTSLLPIIEGQQAERHIFAQAHEAVGAPCIMVREGQFKYNYIHGHQPQLFDLESDPGEWNNLAGAAEYAAIETRLRGLILDRFDPDKMARRQPRQPLPPPPNPGRDVQARRPRGTTIRPLIRGEGALDQYLPPLSS